MLCWGSVRSLLGTPLVVCHQHCGVGLEGRGKLHGELMEPGVLRSALKLHQGRLRLGIREEISMGRVPKALERESPSLGVFW